MVVAVDVEKVVVGGGVGGFPPAPGHVQTRATLGVRKPMRIGVDAVPGAVDVHAERCPRVGRAVVLPQILVAAAALTDAGFEKHLVTFGLGHEARVGHQGHLGTAHQCRGNGRETGYCPGGRGRIGHKPGGRLAIVQIVSVVIEGKMKSAVTRTDANRDRVVGIVRAVGVIRKLKRGPITARQGFSGHNHVAAGVPESCILIAVVADDAVLLERLPVQIATIRDDGQACFRQQHLGVLANAHTSAACPRAATRRAVAAGRAAARARTHAAAGRAATRPRTHAAACRTAPCRVSVRHICINGCWVSTRATTFATARRSGASASHAPRTARRCRDSARVGSAASA